jgi:hypothetical protein
MPDITFISKENKAFIWQVLMDANAFINIPDSYFNNIQNTYEKLILEISELNNLSLKDKNKLIMTKMYEHIKYFNTQHIQKPLEEIKIQVQDKFKNKQEEFIQLVNHNRPKDISFNEELDKPFDSTELNDKLNEVIANRSYDIIPNNDTKVFNTETKNDKSTTIVEKKVTFVPTPENILSKLKPIESDIEKDDISINDIYSIVKTISINQQLTLQNQDKIIEILNKNFSINIS